MCQINSTVCQEYSKFQFDFFGKVTSTGTNTSTGISGIYRYLVLAIMGAGAMGAAVPSGVASPK